MKKIDPANPAIIPVGANATPIWGMKNEERLRRIADHLTHAKPLVGGVLHFILTKCRSACQRCVRLGNLVLRLRIGAQGLGCRDGDRRGDT